MNAELERLDKVERIWNLIFIGLPAIGRNLNVGNVFAEVLDLEFARRRRSVHSRHARRQGQCATSFQRVLQKFASVHWFPYLLLCCPRAWKRRKYSPQRHGGPQRKAPRPRA